MDGCHTFLKDTSISFLILEQQNICEGELTEKKIYEALARIASNKFPGNDRFTKEFYCTIWNEVKDILMDSWRIKRKENSRCFKKTSNS